MFTNRIGLIALGLMSATQAMASDQDDAKGFIEDSHLSVLARNAYISRDYKGGNQYKAEWGQAFIGTFTSGFTQGTVGVGVDAFGLYAKRLGDGGDRSGAGGIDFFRRGSDGEAANDLARAGAAVKFRFSNTVLKYGDQMPSLPVLSYDNSRLLPESFTGTLITSKEIKGLEVNVGHFTEEAQKSAEGADSGELKSLNVYGASYAFTDRFKASLYGTTIENVGKKQYLGMTYVLPIQKDQSLTFDFNGYKSEWEKRQEELAGLDGRANTIWSLSATYAIGAHSFMIAHQSSTGTTGYSYGGYQRGGGVGDGGTSIYLTNSYWSDFNGQDERSWQLAYGLDFATYGVPGLTYKVALVRGDNITAGDETGGTERELFNQVQYVVQSGPVKDLTLRVRSSILRVSNNVSAYNVGGNEVRVFVDYPINIF